MSLFPNEKLTFAHQKTGAFMPDEDIDAKIDEKYVRGEVRIVTEQARYPLKTIVAMRESGDYELQPDFQRRHRWYDYKRSQLIESFIMNVPVPPIFLYEDRPSHYEVMDGLQRLTAIYDFYTDKLVLEGLEKWPELNGRRYTGLPDQIKRGIDRRYLSSVILLYETAKNEEEAQRLKQMVFERINSGGVRLTPQESRNAIFEGPLNDLCCELSRNEYLCRTWDIPETDDEELLFENKHYQKMEDVELVLRFFANRQRRTLMRSGEGLKEYLDRFLRQGNQDFSQELLEKLKDLFEQTISLLCGTFGEKAFWMMRPWNNGWVWWRGATMTIYDPLMYVFSKYDKDRKQILNHRAKFQRDIEGFYKENYHAFKGKKHIEERIGLFEKFVTDTIGR